MSRCFLRVPLERSRSSAINESPVDACALSLHIAVFAVGCKVLATIMHAHMSRALLQGGGSETTADNRRSDGNGRGHERGRARGVARSGSDFWGAAAVVRGGPATLLRRLHRGLWQGSSMAHECRRCGRNRAQNLWTMLCAGHCRQSKWSVVAAVGGRATLGDHERAWVRGQARAVGWAAHGARWAQVQRHADAVGLSGGYR